MSIYIETPVQFGDKNVISTYGVWHPTAPLLAIISYSQEKGGFVAIVDELGEPLKDVVYPVHPVSQVTALAWHPQLNILASGWENGDLKVWNGIDKDFHFIAGPHKSPIILLQFSEKGGRLVSCDTGGGLVGWKVSSKGQLAIVFHHELKDSVTHIVFQITVYSRSDVDIEGLAKAAVNGDERALDMFSNWRPKTTARKFRIQDGVDNQSFFAGTQSGSVHYINEAGLCIEVLNTDGVPLSYLMHHPSKNSLIVMMEGLTIGHFSVDSQGNLSELTKVKLSSRGQVRGVGAQGLVWTNNSCLAILTGDFTVRVWDIDSNDNYILPMNQKDGRDTKSQNVNQMFCCIAYCKMNQTLCAGTNTGQIYFWTKKQPKYDVFENPEDSWELQNVNAITGTIKHIAWGSVNLRFPLLSVNCVTKVFIMREQSLCTCFCEGIWGTQKTASQILLETADTSALVEVDIQVTNMSISEKYIAVTNGRLISAYQITKKSITDQAMHDSNMNKKNDGKLSINIKFISSFQCDNDGIIVYGKNIITLTLNSILINSFNGIVIASINTVLSEGEPIGIDVTANYLTVFTIEGFLKIYNLDGEEPKLVTPIRNFSDICNDFGEIIQAKTNSSGNKVALTIAAANLIPDGKLYIWDIDQDSLIYYDFRKSKTSKASSFDEPDNGAGSDKTEEEDIDETQAIYAKICTNRTPLFLYWDNIDARLLVCNAKLLKLTNANQKRNFLSLYSANSDTKNYSKLALQDENQIIVTMFVSSEYGIRIQDIKPISSNSKLIGICTPFMVFLNKLSIVREVMSDFSGLESCDNSTREAILDFSYNLCLGNVDAAFKAIKLIQSTGVWNSLARMCVKTRRLDVAAVCLGHMQNARAARALRLAVADDTLPQEAKLAVLAIQLNMVDEAEQLYLQCGRSDLLNKLYQHLNKMDEALRTAETSDRINLKHTQYMYARNLEQSGNTKEAIAQYEKAGTQVQDIPRMLIEQPLHLQSYMSKSNDANLLRWWGQYIESQGDMNGALQVYAKNGDVYNQVRTLCYMGEESRAAELTRSNQDKAAFYHMARYYETINNVEEAVNFFIKANAYSNAIRLCKENNLTEELWNIGLVATTREKVDCAKYFEDIESIEKAILLYHRAGMLHKALDLAFKSEQFEILHQISSNLSADSDPTIIQKCADYFITNHQYDRAVDLLAIGKKYKDAISICMSHNVQLTEDLVEKLTPEKDQVDEETKISVLESLAESLMVQGNYHLATKKFTQAGDRVRAMKALLKSGDTEKIIFFAGVSRQREIYIMAANYLQSLDWQNQPEILRNIITFYSKGRAMDLLANFYVACAQIEIDEFQNYEKAYGALTEASRCLAKISSTGSALQNQKATEIVQRRMSVIKKFIDIRRLFERGDTPGGIAQCRQLLVSGGQNLEESVRRGDIYALMIYQYVKEENYVEAKKLVAELKQVLSASTNLPISYYLNKELIEALARGLGVSPTTIVPPATKTSTESTMQSELEIEEEVDE